MKLYLHKLFQFSVLAMVMNAVSGSGAFGVTVENGGTGPYAAIVTEDASLPGMTIFRPKDLSPFEGENKLPVLLWGNGACANSAFEHKNFLNEIASNGYIVLAIGLLDQIDSRDDSRTATHSSQLLEALDWIEVQNESKKTVYSGKIDVSKVAAMGMSCGGLQAIEISDDPRVRTTIVCNSGVLPEPSDWGNMPSLVKDDLKTDFKAPVLYIMGGQSDIAYDNAMDDFARVNHVTIVMTNLDVGHGGTYHKPQGGEFTPVALAWVDWQLKGRQEASKMFLGEDSELAQDSDWTIEVKNFEKLNTAAISPLETEFVYEAVVTLGEFMEVGETSLGHRRYIPITGGTFEGPNIRGTILPGGADWQTERSDGIVEIDALYSMRCDDGTVIIIRNQGVVAEGGSYIRTAARFEVPIGPHDWLSRSQFVGSVTGGSEPGTVIIRIFRVL